MKNIKVSHVILEQLKIFHFISSDVKTNNKSGYISHKMKIILL